MMRNGIPSESTSLHDGLPAATLPYIQTALVPILKEKFESMIKVRRVQGPLFGERVECGSIWPNSGNPGVCDSHISQECGDTELPSSILRNSRRQWTCEADDILLATQNNHSSPHSAGCYTPNYDADNVTIDEACLRSIGCTLHGTDSNGTEPVGVSNADLYLIVTSTDTDACGGGRRAHAAPCQLDQYDRPTIGYINLCMGDYPVVNQDSDDWKVQYWAAVREIIHLLGFNADMFPLFREDDGVTPRTPRDDQGDVPTTNYVCPQQSTALSQRVPRTARSSSRTSVPLKAVSAPVSMIVTPRVKQMARTIFGCDTLEGAELEGNGDACWNSVWEMRNHADEIMTMAFRNEQVKPYLSPLTLALMEDTGGTRSTTRMRNSIPLHGSRVATF